jgi:DNA-directed RNA polymerase specialized sigma24 family protein
VRRYRPAAYRAALSVTGNADDAEDATQDAASE